MTAIFSLVVGYPPLVAQALVGYAANAGTQGGTGGTGYTIDSTSGTADDQLATRLEQSGARVITVTGDGVVELADPIVVTDGSWTLDGTAWDGVLKHNGFIIRSSDVIVTGVKFRPGDDVDSPDEVDALTINPGIGDPAISKIAIRNCDTMWGPDVSLAVLNDVRDLTVQGCIIGPGLQYSDHSEAGGGSDRHNMGLNVTVPNAGDPDNEYGRRMTFYRNYFPHNWQRNLKFEHVIDVEAIENVVHNYSEAGHGNPQRANIVGTYYSKGPDTGGGTDVFEPDPGYDEYTDAVYFAGSVGRTAAGGAFTPTVSIDETRGTPWTMSGLAAVTMDAARAAAVVAAAGPPIGDSVDTTLKGNFTARDGDWWNGVGHGAPEAAW